MRRVLLSFLASLALAGSMLAPTFSTASAEPHPLIRRAIGAQIGRAHV